MRTQLSSVTDPEEGAREAGDVLVRLTHVRALADDEVDVVDLFDDGVERHNDHAAVRGERLVTAHLVLRAEVTQLREEALQVGVGAEESATHRPDYKGNEINGVAYKTRRIATNM